MSADILAVQQLSYNGIGEVRLPTGDTIGGVAYLKTEVFSPDGLALANVHLLLKNSFANPLIQVTENFDPNTGATTRGVFWQSDFDTTTSTDDENQLNFTVTSEGNGRVLINSGQEIDANIQLINMNGQVVQTNQEFIQRGENTIDFSNVESSGQYVVFIVDREKGEFSSHRIAIVK